MPILHIGKSFNQSRAYPIAVSVVSSISVSRAPTVDPSRSFCEVVCPSKMTPLDVSERLAILIKLHIL